MLAAVCRLQPVLLILMTSVRTLPPAGISQHSVLNVFDKLVFTFFLNYLLQLANYQTRMENETHKLFTELPVYQFITIYAHTCIN